MKICFILSAATKNISGGYKIVYEYANRLINRGHSVTIFYNCNADKIRFGNKLQLITFIYRKFLVYKEPTWFNLDSHIKKHALQNLEGRSFKEFDAVILCGSGIVLDYFSDNLKNDNVFSLIQDFENWELSTTQVIESFKKETVNIAISKWLQDLVIQKSGSNCFLISNPIDLNVFYRKIKMTERKETISMLYHEAKRKGCKYGLKVLNEIHTKYPEIKFILFGYPCRPQELPLWIDYHQGVNSNKLVEIYNQTTIFIVPSIEEGYGLTGAESMACGCALVSSYTQGVREYADDECALFSDPRDTNKMVENIEYLINHPEFKVRMANLGYEKVKKLSWNKAVDEMEKILKNEGTNP